MDSNKATIGTFYLTIATLMFTAAGVGLMLWAQLNPQDRNQAPLTDQDGAFMRFISSGWIPIIVVSLGLVLAVILQVRLAGRLRENTKLRTKIDRLEDEKRSLDEALTRRRSEMSKLEDQLDRNKMLIALADAQRIEIDNYVVLEKVILGTMDLMASVPSVRFGVYVTNKSVFDISLNYEMGAEVGGAINFEDFEFIELSRPKSALNTVKDLASGGTASLTIKQLLTPEQAGAIYRAKSSESAKFEFDDLVIDIVGGRYSPDVTPRQLKIKNTFLAPFPVDRQTRGKRIKGLSQVLGSCIQMHEPLRIGNEPLQKSVIENWQSRALAILEREGYTEDAARKVFQEMTHGDAAPETSASSQRNWLHFCIVVLEDLISKEIKQYV